MASSYTPNRNLEKPAYNDYAGNPTGWSGPINNNWTAIDTALAGVLSLNATGSVGTVALSITQSSNLIFSVTGLMTGNAIYTLPLNTAATGIVSGQWIVYNNTTGAYTLTISPVSGGGRSASIPQGARVVIMSDGTNVDALTAIAGSTTQVIYNSSGSLTGSSSFTFNGTALTAAVNVSLGSGSSSTLTLNGTAVSIPNSLNFDSNTFYIDATNNRVGVGTATPAYTCEVSGTLADSLGNVRRFPVDGKVASYTLVASDNGKVISTTTGGITVNSGVFAVGDAVTIYNNSSSTQTVTAGVGVTLRKGGTTSIGNRTLDSYALCAIVCVATDVFVATGPGVN